MSLSLKFNGSSSIPSPYAPWRNGWLVDCGFTLQPGAEFNHDVNAVHLTQIRYLWATQTLYFEFRLDTSASQCYRFVFECPVSEAISGSGDEPRNRTFFAAARVGCCFATRKRSEAYVIPTDANVGDAAYGTSWSPNGLEAAGAIGWGYITLGQVRDYFKDAHQLIVSNPSYFTNVNQFALFPQTDFVIEPARVQTLVNHRAQSINIANYDGFSIPNPCTTDELIPPSDAAESNGIAFNGDVKFKAGFNCELTFNAAGNFMEIAAKRGAGAGPVCEDRGPYGSDYGYYYNPASVDRSCRNVIFTINGVGADAFGKFTITTGNGVSVQINEVPHALVIMSNPISRFVCE